MHASVAAGPLVKLWVLPPGADGVLRIPSVAGTPRNLMFVAPDPVEHSRDRGRRHGRSARCGRHFDVIFTSFESKHGEGSPIVSSVVIVFALALIDAAVDKISGASSDGVSRVIEGWQTDWGASWGELDAAPRGGLGGPPRADGGTGGRLDG